MAGPDTWVRAYSDQFPDWDSAIGAYEFPIDAYSGRNVDYVLEGASGVPELAAKPAILLEGMADQGIPPDRAIADFRGVWSNAPVVELPGVGHFCQEDAPDVLVTNIVQFLAVDLIRGRSIGKRAGLGHVHTHMLRAVHHGRP